MVNLHTPGEILLSGALRRDIYIKGEPEPNYDNADLAQVLGIQALGVSGRK